MGLKKKFILLAGIMGMIMVVMSVIGYFMSSSNLRESVDGEIRATVGSKSNEINGWLIGKKATAVSTADYFSSMNGDLALLKRKELLGSVTSDKEILDMALGLEDGYFNFYRGNELTGVKDPRQRPWYKDTKAKDAPMFTEAYEDVSTKMMVVSVTAPVKAGGSFIGAICEDIGLDVLSIHAEDVNYHGEGLGVIIEAGGNILATENIGKAMQNIKEVEGIGDHFDEMKNQGEGYFEFKQDGEDKIFAYSTVPETGWIIGVSVPYDTVFAALTHMKLVYGFLIVFGLVMASGLCMSIAGRITKPIVELEAHALELSKGNLSMKAMPITTEDEIGSLTNAFNTMNDNLRNLIGKMATTSEQVSASSEELTASAHQSADASVHVAETVSDVSFGMEKQTADVDKAKESVDRVFKDITAMAEKARNVTEVSGQTADAAERGSELMEKAIERMGKIESSVMASADVVKKLGDNSQQIGQIVEAISAISEQTNLLSLNAAIEAARAGEHGRGFAVVAEEVRKLAAESQSSAEQIKARIASIQNDTAAAVTAMQAGTDEVKNGTAAIREVGVQFSDILSMVNAIKQQIDDISGSVNTVSEGANRIVTAVDSIDEVSRKTSESTKSISSATEEQSASNEEIAAASQALSNLAGDMQTAIGQFKL